MTILYCTTSNPEAGKSQLDKSSECVVFSIHGIYCICTLLSIKQLFDLLLLLLLRGRSLASRVVLLDQSLNLGRRSTDKLVGGGGVAVLEDVEGGHGLDVVLGGQLGKVVNVDLDKVDVRVLVGPPAREEGKKSYMLVLW